MRSAPPPQSPNAKFELLRPYVSGRRVLDVGAVGGSMERTEEPGWLHGLLKEVAASCTGIDILAEECAALRARGFDVRCASAETFEFDTRFQVVVAADVLEHLSNPGLFLERARAALEDKGHLLVSVPNASALLYLLLSAATGETRVNPDHVAYHCGQTLRTLLARHGFWVERTWYLEMVYPFSGGVLARSRLARAAWRAGVSVMPRTLRNTILVSARKRSD